MPLDTRWKNPQGSDPKSLHLWAQDLIRELRRGDYLTALEDRVSALETANTRPAFSAHRNNIAQTISTGTVTKIELTTEDFDSNANFDSATNYRFTPTVAGKYVITFTARLTALADGALFVASISKNGGVYMDGNINVPGAASDVSSVAAAVIDFNGTTDYVEFTVFHSHGSDRDVDGNSTRTRASGMRIGA